MNEIEHHYWGYNLLNFVACAPLHSHPKAVFELCLWKMPIILIIWMTIPRACFSTFATPSPPPFLLILLLSFIVWPVFVTDITRALIGSHALIVGHCPPVMPTTHCGLQNQSKKPYKQLTNLERSVLSGKSQTSPCRKFISLGQYGEVSVWDFPVKTSLSINK